MTKTPQASLRYTGKGNSGSTPYLASAALQEAVNLAMFLGRPLLLKGEPGCGKTQLARHVADELGLAYRKWAIKSTSRARDGLYVYDAIGRLRDVQLAATQQLSAERLQRSVHDPRCYVRLGHLGEAFESTVPMVILIDEIDKADIDFPNDLLQELELKPGDHFPIDETGEDVQARSTPLIIITSNDEKDLPDAFLRRCLFFYIEFPNRDRLTEIVKLHFPDAHERLVSAAVQRFLALRDEMHDKKASTSELIDWFRVLREEPEEEALRRMQEQLPHLSVLIKSWPDLLDQLRRMHGEG